MSDPEDARLHAVVTRALTDMLEAAGFPGGVLLVVTPAGKLLFISAIPDHLPTQAEELLRTALHYLEVGPPSRMPPMNG
jgi:hypothetical protein